jgi:tetratricopeptide (TPR) repeat protein
MHAAPQTQSLYAQAQQSFAAGDLKNTVELCRQMLDVDPQFAHGYHMMSSLFRVTGNYEKALTFADMAIKLAPQVCDFYVQQGQIWFAMGKWQEAAQAFKKAGDVDPTNNLSLILLADCHSQLGEYDEAVRMFTRARAIQDIPEIDEHEGICLLMQGETTTAEMMFDRVIARRPDYYWGYIHKGKLLVERNQGDQAAAYFRKALAIQPNAEDALQGLEACGKHSIH